MSLSFNDYQRQAAGTAIYPAVYVQDTDGDLNGASYIYPAIGLAGEAGELSEKVKKLIRDQQGVVFEEDVKSIAKECGDILWYLSAICKEFGLDLETVAQMNLDKLASRKERGVLGGSGDNR